MNYMKHLNFLVLGDGLDCCMNICKNNILVHNPNASGKHGTTKLSNQWERVFKGQLKAFYNSIFADSAELIGYN